MTKRKIFWIAIGATTGYFIWLVGFAALTSFLEEGTLDFWEIPLNILPGIALYLGLNRFYQKHHFTPLYVFPPTEASGKRGLSTLLVGLVLSVITVVLTGVLVQFVFYPIDQGNTVIIDFLFDTPLYTMGYMLIPAIGEELLMRGGLLHAFMGIGKKKWGIVISSVLFGFLHIISMILNQMPFNLENMIWLFNLAGIGFFLAFLYLRFGLLCVIFLHWLWNASFYGEMLLIEKNIFSLIVTLSIIAGYELYRYIQKKRSSEEATLTG